MYDLRAFTVMGSLMELRAVNGYNGAKGEGSVDGAVKTPTIIESGIQNLSTDQRDEQALVRLGKKPVLKVRDLVLSLVDMGKR